tara:strand:+ start:893 stop:1066 length:174 start_codon:yes stop_codon:yes gene_type:complete
MTARQPQCITNIHDVPIDSIAATGFMVANTGFMVANTGFMVAKYTIYEERGAEFRLL